MLDLDLLDLINSNMKKITMLEIEQTRIKSALAIHNEEIEELKDQCGQPIRFGHHS